MFRCLGEVSYVTFSSMKEWEGRPFLSQLPVVSANTYTLMDGNMAVTSSITYLYTYATGVEWSDGLGGTQTSLSHYFPPDCSATVETTRIEHALGTVLVAVPWTVRSVR